MKKFFSCVLCFLLAACSVPPHFYPYEGNKTVKSEGGFFDGYISADSLGTSLFEKKPEYKYDVIDIYASGLPQGKTCTLLGHISGSNHNEIERIVFKMGGNVLSRSDVSMPVQFKEGGVLSAGMGAGVETSTIWNGFGASNVVTYRYNIFECK